MCDRRHKVGWIEFKGPELRQRSKELFNYRGGGGKQYQPLQ